LDITSIGFRFGGFSRRSRRRPHLLAPLSPNAANSPPRSASFRPATPFTDFEVAAEASRIKSKPLWTGVSAIPS
ncbi:MAG: hypothetical protein O2960_06200, partial [Verrucomicrobia bacterium]|nr:hypothetical protein [Verrucomicrobiota bacterium]